MFNDYVQQLAEAKKAYQAGDQSAADHGKQIRQAAYEAGLDLFRLEAAAHQAAHPSEEINWSFAIPQLLAVYQIV